MDQSLPASKTIALTRYSAEAKALVAASQGLADERKHQEVSPLHLLARALELNGFVELLSAVNVGSLELGARVSESLSRLPTVAEPSYLSQGMLALLERAQSRADLANGTAVDVEHLVHALTQEVRGPAGDLLTAFGILPGSLESHYPRLRRPSVGRELSQASADSSLIDLVVEAQRGALEPTLGREPEVRRLLTVLERRQKCHALLVGEPGVGKSAIVRALARRIADGDVPTSLSSAGLTVLEPSSLLTGARLRADVEERLRKLLQTLSVQRDGMLFVRGIEQWLGQGATGSGLLEPIKASMSRGGLRVLATTTPDGLRRLSEKDPELLRHFSILPVEEPSVAQAIEILRGLAGRLEAHHQVTIEASAVNSAVELGKRYLQDRFLPDSALDLLDESAAALRVETDGLSGDKDAKIQRFLSLRIQVDALLPTTDPDSLEVKQRLTLEKDELEGKVEVFRAERESRRGVVAAIRQLRLELEQAQREQGAAKAARNFARLGELEHQVIPSLEARLQKAILTVGLDKATAAAPALRAEQVAQTLAAWTGIPVQKMLEGETQKLVNMAERLEERVVGQPEATSAIARAVKRGRVGLRDQKRPIGSFLFLGPSGVGKTELAKAVAEFLFDDEQALTRLDMSEFMERHMAQRLVGAPPGYADSEQGGFLTEAVRKRPYSVLLFDEVEKAHADVFNLLLQILDDGRLTDGRGRTADFSNTVVIMTSNIGSQRILDAELTEFDTDDGRAGIKAMLLEELRRFFRPELLNRIDETVVFRPLSREVLQRILRIQLKGLDRLLAPRGVSLVVSEAVQAKLVEWSYEPAFGARPLRRVVAQKLQDPLADALLGTVQPGAGKIHVDLDAEGKLVFRSMAEASAVTSPEVG